MGAKTARSMAAYTILMEHFLLYRHTPKHTKES
jgi:hypothetical protein